MRYQASADFAVTCDCPITSYGLRLSRKISWITETHVKSLTRSVLRHSVQLWPQKIEYLALEQIYPNAEIYKVPEDFYANFQQSMDKPCFGYMKGLLPLVYACRDSLVI